MQIYTISNGNDSVSVFNDINNRIKILNLNCDIEFNNNEIIIKLFDCYEEKYFVNELSMVISGYIIENYQYKLLFKMLSANHNYLLHSERRAIIENIYKENIIDSKDIIKECLVKYFEENRNIYIEGFINFRLNSYLKYLEKISDKAVDKYLIQKEYEDFISLLKFYVSIQNSRIKILNVVCNSDNTYTLFDENNVETTNDNIIEYIKDSYDGKINYDDFLMSTLITLSPEKIIFHKYENMENEELKDTINKVFGKKISFCSKCQMCFPQLLKSESQHNVLFFQ